MTFIEAEDYILNIPKFAGKNSLADTYTLLCALGGTGSAKIIHIAGTNGKGSTANYIDTVLREAHFSTGLFTSPHLVSMRERISINGTWISEEEFLDCFLRVREVTEQLSDKAHHPSFFEFLFLMAMAEFTRRRVDYIVLETGLGGRLDATNCIPEKTLCVITDLGLDHTEYLGSTLAEIAGEKAGILRPHTPVVFAERKAAASAVIRERAKELNSTCYGIKPENLYRSEIFNKDYIDFSIRCDYDKLENIRITGRAEYQMMNAALACVSLSLLKEERLTDKMLRRGIARSCWRGRFTALMDRVYVDGAHNPDGMRALLDTIRMLPTEGRRFLVFGVASDKSYREMLADIRESALFDGIFLCPLKSNRSAQVSVLYEELQNTPVLAVSVYPDAETALSAALSQRGEQDLIFAAGSLYLVGELLAAGALTERALCV